MLRQPRAVTTWCKRARDLVAPLLCILPGTGHAVERYAALTLSPDGKSVAYVENQTGGRHAGIVVRRADDGATVSRLNPCATCGYSDLTFGPRGELAFLARVANAGSVTLMLTRNGAPPKPVTTIRGLAQMPRFDHSGSRIALLVTSDAAKNTGSTQPGARQIGEIGYKVDSQRLVIVDLRSTEGDRPARPVSPPDRFVYEYDWSPDDRSVVATTASGDGDRNWWTASLDLIDVASGATRTVAKPRVQVRYPRVAPDGKSVAFIGGLMSDYGNVGGDVWIVSLANGNAIDLTAKTDRSVQSLEWTERGLLAVAQSGHDAALISIDARTGQVVTLWRRPADLAAGEGKAAYDRTGMVAATVVEDFEHAPAIFAGPPRAVRQITHENDAIAPIVSARAVTWLNDGLVLHGWLLGQRSARRAGTVPLIVNVHGGPANAWYPNFIQPGGITAELTGRGYYVFLPNPRGSLTQGQAFTTANRGDFGGGDLRDLLSGIDAVEKLAPIDPARIGIMGKSYGGFMTMWATAHSDRFKAAVAGAGISDWTSYYGTNGINTWMLPYFGASLYDAPERFARVSPLRFVNAVHTPTFMFVGERDIETPPGQSLEWWRALIEHSVPTQLVIYPDEGHELRDPARNADMIRRVVAWFERYLVAAPVPR